MCIDDFKRVVRGQLIGLVNRAVRRDEGTETAGGIADRYKPLLVRARGVLEEAVALGKAEKP